MLICQIHCQMIVYLTGILEIPGALGPLLPATRPAAGFCLTALLVALYPASFNVARKQIPLRGQKPAPFWLRLFVQLVYIGVAIRVALTA